jgi:hypothetical protein
MFVENAADQQENLWQSKMKKKQVAPNRLTETINMVTTNKL